MGPLTQRWKILSRWARRRSPCQHPQRLNASNLWRRKIVGPRNASPPPRPTARCAFPLFYPRVLRRPSAQASDADGPSSAPPSKKRRKPSKAAVESDDEGLIDPSPKSKRKKASAKKDAAEEPATSKPASAKPASKAKRPPAKRSSHAAAEVRLPTH